MSQGYFKSHPLYTKDVLKIIKEMGINKYSNMIYTFLLNKGITIDHIVENFIQSVISSREDLFYDLLRTSDDNAVRKYVDAYKNIRNSKKIKPENKLKRLKTLSEEFDYNIVSGNSDLFFDIFMIGSDSLAAKLEELLNIPILIKNAEFMTLITDIELETYSNVMTLDWIVTMF